MLATPRNPGRILQGPILRAAYAKQSLRLARLTAVACACWSGERLREIRVEPVGPVPPGCLKLRRERRPGGASRLVGVQQHRSSITDHVVELPVIESELVPQPLDLGIELDRLDPDLSIGVDDRVRPQHPGAGPA